MQAFGRRVGDAPGDSLRRDERERAAEHEQHAALLAVDEHFSLRARARQESDRGRDEALARSGGFEDEFEGVLPAHARGSVSAARSCSDQMRGFFTRR